MPLFQGKLYYFIMDIDNKRNYNRKWTCNCFHVIFDASVHYFDISLENINKQ